MSYASSTEAGQYVAQTGKMCFEIRREYIFQVAQRDMPFELRQVSYDSFKCGRSIALPKQHDVEFL